MGGRARSLIRWLRHRSRRVSSSSFHLTSSTNDDNTATGKDLHAHSLPHQPHAEEEEEEEGQEVAEGPESAPEGCIVFEERDAGLRAPVRLKPPPMDPSKKVGQLNSVPVIALLDLCGLFCSPFFASFSVPTSASDRDVWIHPRTAPAARGAFTRFLMAVTVRGEVSGVEI
jgi:hypothetical protein